MSDTLDEQKNELAAAIGRYARRRTQARVRELIDYTREVAKGMCHDLGIPEDPHAESLGRLAGYALAGFHGTHEHDKGLSLKALDRALIERVVPELLHQLQHDEAQARVSPPGGDGEQRSEAGPQVGDEAAVTIGGPRPAYPHRMKDGTPFRLHREDPCGPWLVLTLADNMLTERVWNRIEGPDDEMEAVWEARRLYG